MDKVDWGKFAINYRNYLKRAGHEDLAGLLISAQVEPYIDYENGDAHSCLLMRIPNSLLHLYEQNNLKHRQILRDAANSLIPQLDIEGVIIASQLDETSDDGTAIVDENPTFGSPSREPKFSSDVFVIMPFAPEFKPIYDDHIVSTVTELNLTIKRGDDFFTRRSIMSDVWSALIACRLVIAECSGRNPNVFYELGIAHTLGKPVVLITQTIDDIPFDLRHLRYVEYQNTLAGASTLKKQLGNAITELLPVKSDADFMPSDYASNVEEAGDIPF